MNLDKLYMIDQVPGFSNQISRLVSMMNYSRWTTLESVKGLSTEQLDFLLDSDSNSIGALLKHIMAVEYAYYLNTIEKRELSEEERQEWGPALELGERGRREIKNNPLEYYIELMNEIREKTLKAFSELTDEWLDEYELEPHLGNSPVNNYFKWFHVFEDEINHRGQIRIIRKRIGNG
ncbi:integrase [Lederbergia ruris]|uniref:Integrase n=2 Tax=Lederbergia ruris TaxID=217495 RepID=A0ABQ4KQG7_9BACI|nr:integrase [Lederbergia ruris]